MTNSALEIYTIELIRVPRLLNMLKIATLYLVGAFGLFWEISTFAPSSHNFMICNLKTGEQIKKIKWNRGQELLEDLNEMSAEDFNQKWLQDMGKT